MVKWQSKENGKMAYQEKWLNGISSFFVHGQQHYAEKWDRTKGFFRSDCELKWEHELKLKRKPKSECELKLKRKLKLERQLKLERSESSVN